MRKTGEPIGDHELLTQYVFGGEEPRNVPRPSDRDGLSALRGQSTLQEAARFVRKARWPHEGDSVRHVLVRDLREAGFIVDHTPNRRNPLHTSIRIEAQWNVDVAHAFDACFAFHDPQRGGE